MMSKLSYIRHASHLEKHPDCSLFLSLHPDADCSIDRKRRVQDSQCSIWQGYDIIVVCIARTDLLNIVSPNLPIFRSSPLPPRPYSYSTNR